MRNAIRIGLVFATLIGATNLSYADRCANHTGPKPCYDSNQPVLNVKPVFPRPQVLDEEALDALGLPENMIPDVLREPKYLRDPDYLRERFHSEP